MQTIGHGLLSAAAMLWEMLWALVLGFGISAAMQVFVSKEKMAQLFGRTGLREGTRDGFGRGEFVLFLRGRGGHEDRLQKRR